MLVFSLFRKFRQKAGQVLPGTPRPFFRPAPVQDPHTQSSRPTMCERKRANRIYFFSSRSKNMFFPVAESGIA
jgi:hypothetical protein